jgi:hypothetical protein
MTGDGQDDVGVIKVGMLVFENFYTATMLVSMLVCSGILCWYLVPFFLIGGWALFLVLGMPALLLGLACVILSVYMLVKASRGLIRLRSRRFFVNPHPPARQDSQKAKLINPLLALQAGLAGLLLSSQRFKFFIKKAFDIPSRELLDEYDAYESAMKSGNYLRAYRHLRIILEPQVFTSVQTTVYNVYSTVLNREVLHTEARLFLHRVEQTPQLLIKLGTVYLMYRDYNGCADCIKRFEKLGGQSEGENTLAVMMLDRAIQMSEYVDRRWAILRERLRCRETVGEPPGYESSCGPRARRE